MNHHVLLSEEMYRETVNTDIKNAAPMAAQEKHSGATQAFGDEWLIPYLRAWERHNVHFGVIPHSPNRFLSSRYLKNVWIEREIAENGDVNIPDIPGGITLALTGECMRFRFSYAHHDWNKRGMMNEEFLNPTFLKEVFRRIMATNDLRITTIVLRVGEIYVTENVSAAKLLKKLRQCFSALPSTYRYGIELFNERYLVPNYFDLLREQNVAHLLAANSRGPGLDEQLQNPHVLPADRVLVRVDQPLNGSIRSDIVAIVRRCLEEKKAVCIYVQNEGKLIRSLIRVMEALNHDLAKLSPIKRVAA